MTTSKAKAPRGVPRPGECTNSRTKARLFQSQIVQGEYRCACGAVLALRRLAPGMQGEPRVSDILPAHKPVNPAMMWRPVEVPAQHDGATPTAPAPQSSSSGGKAP